VFTSRIVLFYSGEIDLGGGTECSEWESRRLIAISIKLVNNRTALDRCRISDGELDRTGKWKEGDKWSFDSTSDSIP